ncbi:DUF3168 domain-containing protein [Megasphaera sp.]|uniref:tail completion protein gp17 n=1 Tax=Megasphaera sp. TaxID=2023260 RepID=UPI003521E1DA
MIRSIPFTAVQRALYELLSQGQSIPVYDSIITGKEKFPYIYLGAFEGVPTNGNKTVAQHTITQTIHVWSVKDGKKEVNGILDDIAYLLTKYTLPLKTYRQIGDAHIVQYQVVGERYESGANAYQGILLVSYTIEQIND